MKITLKGCGGYETLRGINFPIVVEADLYKGHYYVKKTHINDVVPSVPREPGVEYVFTPDEVTPFKPTGDLLGHCEEVAKEVATWPEWKREGADVTKFLEDKDAIS